LKEKEKYSIAEINVVMLTSTDVISTSALGSEGFDENGWV
jgi:hypothetical protein